MPDYGGITFGGFGGWGGYGGGFGGGGSPRSYGGQPSRLPRAGFPSQIRNFTIGGTNGQGWADNYLYGAQANLANAQNAENESALFDQSINERNMSLQHKYDMETLQAQLQAQQMGQWQQMMMAGMNLPTNQQIQTGLGRFMDSKRNYTNQAANGLYSDQEESGLMLDAYNQIGDTTKAMQRGYTDMAASQGMGVNPNAIYYMGNAGQYKQAAARHGAQMDLAQQEAAAKERAYGALTGIAGTEADLDITPTRENAWMGMMGNMGGMYGPSGGGQQQLPYGNRRRPAPQAGGAMQYRRSY